MSVMQEETTHFLFSWLSLSSAPFAHCTDAAAVQQLAAAVGVSSLDLASPPEELRAPLMTRLVSPEFVGCVHTKFQLLQPDSYAVRR